MKVLFRISLILAILLPVTWFGFIFFVFGGCVIPIVTPLMAYILVLVLIPAVLLSPFLLLVDLAVVFFQWKKRGIHSLFPPMIMLVGFLTAIPLTWVAHTLCHKRFERHLPQYEQAVVEIEKSITPGKEHVTPSGWIHLSITPPIVYREDDGSFTIEFLVGGVGPPPRHAVYIYRSDGIIGKDSQTAKRWHWPTQVNEHWFRASD